MGASHLNIMPNEDVNNDTPNVEEDVLEDIIVGDDDDVDTLKEKFKKVDDQNKQLFARTKKAEGFELVEGKYVKKDPEVKPEPEVKPDLTPQQVSDEDLDKRLDKRDVKRDLDSLSTSTEFRKELGDYIEFKGGSVNQALETGYFKARKLEVDTEIEIQKASLDGGEKGTAQIDPGDIKPTDLDLTKDEDLEKLRKWEDKVRKDLG